MGGRAVVVETAHRLGEGRISAGQTCAGSCSSPKVPRDGRVSAPEMSQAIVPSMLATTLGDMFTQHDGDTAGDAFIKHAFRDALARFAAWNTGSEFERRRGSEQCRANRRGLREPEPFERRRPASESATVTLRGSQFVIVLARTVWTEQCRANRCGFRPRRGDSGEFSSVLQRGSVPDFDILEAADEMRDREERIRAEPTHIALAQVQSDAQDWAKSEHGTCEAAIMG